jgi:hypothetical protein
MKIWHKDKHSLLSCFQSWGIVQQADQGQIPKEEADLLIFKNIFDGTNQVNTMLC